MTAHGRHPSLRLLTALAAAGLVAACAGPASKPRTEAAAPPQTRAPLGYAIGADLSFLAYAEQHGAKFKDDGKVKPALQIFRDHGYNWVRLRLFHSPGRLPNNLGYTLALARQAKEMGFRFLLDLHYSDTWADPHRQTIPRAWEGKSHNELVEAVREYTGGVIASFRAGNAMPDMVQIGNEVTNGMLWPDGKLPGNWDHFADLIKAGIAGVDGGRGDAPRPLIMIHIEKPGDVKTTRWFFDNLLERGVQFDVIGQSYYPWWHGSLLELRAGLAFMAERYHKDILLAEVAYNWKPSEYRKSPAPFPESPEGQRQFLESVNRAVMETPDGLGKGVFWWEPAVVGPLNRRGMFDDDGNALPVIDVFDKYTRGKVPGR